MKTHTKMVKFLKQYNNMLEMLNSWSKIIQLLFEIIQKAKQTKNRKKSYSLIAMTIKVVIFLFNLLTKTYTNN